MKAQELRIGNNIVFSEENEICKVVGIPPQHTGKGIDVYFDSGEEIWIEIEKFHPLEITPELLEKAGFYNPDSQNVYSFNSKSLYVRTLQICNVINFHHLQNIIFDLTGEEITI